MSGSLGCESCALSNLSGNGLSLWIIPILSLPTDAHDRCLPSPNAHRHFYANAGATGSGSTSHATPVRRTVEEERHALRTLWSRIASNGMCLRCVRNPPSVFAYSAGRLPERITQPQRRVAPEGIEAPQSNVSYGFTASKLVQYSVVSPAAGS